jgi:hypothetical protein
MGIDIDRLTETEPTGPNRRIVERLRFLVGTTSWIAKVWQSSVSVFFRIPQSEGPC